MCRLGKKKRLFISPSVSLCRSRIDDRAEPAAARHCRHPLCLGPGDPVLLLRSLLVVQLGLNETFLLQLHLSRSTLQAVYINFTTKSKIISHIYHERHHALRVPAVARPFQSLCLCLLRKRRSAAPGDGGKAPARAAFEVCITAQRQRKT